MPKRSDSASRKSVVVRAPETFWEELSQHIRKRAGVHRPNRNAWILDAIIEKMQREKEDN